VDLDTFTCLPSEGRRDWRFIIGVGPDCYERPSLALTTRAGSSDKNQPRDTSADEETHVPSSRNSHP
jgi:hypothetical protein